MPFKYLILMMLLCITEMISAQQSVSLAGSWRFQTDPNDVGVTENWFAKTLTGDTKLPGSMLENGQGDAVTLQTKWTGSIYDSSWFFNPRFGKYRQP